jgi:hypothetical protein
MIASCAKATLGYWLRFSEAPDMNLFDRGTIQYNTALTVVDIPRLIGTDIGPLLVIVFWANLNVVYGFG